MENGLFSYVLRAHKGAFSVPALAAGCRDGNLAANRHPIRPITHSHPLEPRRHVGRRQREQDRPRGQGPVRVQQGGQGSHQGGGGWGEHTVGRGARFFRLFVGLCCFCLFDIPSLFPVRSSVDAPFDHPHPHTSHVQEENK